MLEGRFSRSELIQALQGDFALIGRLILRWDIEAQRENAARLPSEKVLRAQFLAEKLPSYAPSASLKTLPQTYVSAGILLALIPPADIVALPKGLREQEELYPVRLTKQIPLDIDHYTTEKLYLARPDIAFVSSHYSHPAALQALANQGIAVKASPPQETIQDILQEINALGEAVGRQTEAELLGLFMEAAFLKFERLPKKPENTVFLSYYDHFYLPRANTITGALVRKAGLAIPTVSPLELKEHLLKWDPETLVIAVPHGFDILPWLYNDPGFSTLRALRNHRVRILNDEIMQTPTHFSVLAYYDLIEALRP